MRKHNNNIGSELTLGNTKLMAVLVVAVLATPGTVHARPLKEIAFGAQVPASLANTVALTFDDGPDSQGATAKILDTLRTEAVRATFFLNTETDATDLVHRAETQRLLRKMADDGHEIGNHTARHMDLSTLSPPTMCAEIDRAEAQVRAASGGRVANLTLLRAPFGHPFQPEDRAARPQAFAAVSQIVAPRAVHVGWTIDPSDWSGRPAQEILQEVLRQIDQEHKRGVIILHAPQAETAKVLQALIHEIRRRGLHFVTVEDYVRAKYGADSQRLLARGLRRGRRHGKH